MSQKTLNIRHWNNCFWYQLLTTLVVQHCAYCRRDFTLLNCRSGIESRIALYESVGNDVIRSIPQAFSIVTQIPSLFFPLSGRPRLLAFSPRFSRVFPRFSFGSHDPTSVHEIKLFELIAGPHCCHSTTVRVSLLSALTGTGVGGVL